jgi:hypothetical protein
LCPHSAANHSAHEPQQSALSAPGPLRPASAWPFTLPSSPRTGDRPAGSRPTQAHTSVQAPPSLLLHGHLGPSLGPLARCNHARRLFHWILHFCFSVVNSSSSDQSSGKRSQMLILVLRKKKESHQQFFRKFGKSIASSLFFLSPVKT